MSILPALCQNWVCQRDLFLEWVPVTSKGDLQWFPNKSECSFQAGYHFPAFASLAPAGYHMCMNAVCCCFEVCLLPIPAGTLINLLTPNILGAIRTPPELLEPSSDPCGFCGDLMQIHYTPYIFPLVLPRSSKWNYVECIPLGCFVLRLAETRRLWLTMLWHFNRLKDTTTSTQSCGMPVYVCNRILIVRL